MALIAGNRSIAFKISHRKCHMQVAGDSIWMWAPASIINGFFNVLKPDHWHGACGWASGASSATKKLYHWSYTGSPVRGGTYDWLRASPHETKYPTDAPGDDGIIGKLPCITRHVYFNAVGSTTSSYASYIGERAVFKCALHHDYDIVSGIPHLEQPGDVITIKQIYNQHANSLDADCEVRIGLASAPRSQAPTLDGVYMDVPTVNYYNSTPGVVTTEASFDAVTITNNIEIYHCLPPVTATPADATASMVMGDWSVTNNRPGLQVGVFAKGGVGVDYHIALADGTHCPQAAMTTYLTLFDIDTIFVAIGQNNPAGDTPDQFGAKLETLMAAYLQCKPGLQFVLCSCYDKQGSTSVLQGFSDKMAEVASSRSDTLFLNMFDAAGDYATNEAADYISADHVHPTIAGGDYFAGVIWDLVVLASGSTGRRWTGDRTVGALLGR